MGEEHEKPNWSCSKEWKVNLRTRPIFVADQAERQVKLAELKTVDLSKFSVPQAPAASGLGCFKIGDEKENTFLLISAGCHRADNNKSFMQTQKGASTEPRECCRSGWSVFPHFWQAIQIKLGRQFHHRRQIDFNCTDTSANWVRERVHSTKHIAVHSIRAHYTQLTSHSISRPDAEAWNRREKELLRKCSLDVFRSVTLHNGRRNCAISWRHNKRQPFSKPTNTIESNFPVEHLPPLTDGLGLISAISFRTSAQLRSIKCVLQVAVEWILFAENQFRGITSEP